MSPIRGFERGCDRSEFEPQQPALASLASLTDPDLMLP